MILGLGIDIIQIPRVEEVYLVFGDKFIKRILSKLEITFIPDSNIASFLAKRFAAKEAFSKAAGCGIGSKMRFIDIEIFKNQEGRPYFSCKTLALVGPKITAHLSISDDYPIAIAQVILSRIE
jgi:holo-[acyl-carrier protein] synthase